MERRDDGPLFVRDNGGLPTCAGQALGSVFASEDRKQIEYALTTVEGVHPQPDSTLAAQDESRMWHLNRIAALKESRLNTIAAKTLRMLSLSHYTMLTIKVVVPMSATEDYRF